MLDGFIFPCLSGLGEQRQKGNMNRRTKLLKSMEGCKAFVEAKLATIEPVIPVLKHLLEEAYFQGWDDAIKASDRREEA